MFYDEKFACIYHVIETLQNRGVDNIDTFMVDNQISNNKGFKDKFRGISNIKEHLDSLKDEAKNDVDSVIFYAKNITSNAFKRDSHIKLQEMSKAVLDSEQDINDLNFAIQSDVTNFADGYITGEGVQSIGDIVEDIYTEIEEDRERGQVGLPMSFPDINKYFTLEDGEVVLIGGRAKGGKSMIFLQETIHKARNGVPVLVWDTEMSTKSWTIRALAHLSGVSITKVKTGKGNTQEEINKINEAKRLLKTLPIYHTYEPNLDVNALFMEAKRLIMTKNLGLIVIDYLKVSNTANTTENEYNLLGNLAIEIKNMAGYFNIPILMGAQLHDKEDRLGDSSKIKRYVSTICLWIAKTAEERAKDGVKAGTHKLIISENRNGIQHDRSLNEYLNFVFQPNIVKISQATEFENLGDDSPY